MTKRVLVIRGGSGARVGRSGRLDRSHGRDEQLADAAQVRPRRIQMHRRAGHKLTDLVGDRDLACASRADRLRVELADEREDELLLLDDRCSASGAFARVRRGSMGSPERIHPRASPTEWPR